MFLSTRLSSSRLLPLTAAALVAVSFGCSDESSNSLTGPQLQSATLSNSQQPDIRAALVAQERHNPRLRAIPGVVGTAVGLNPGGQGVVKVFTASAGVAGIPASLDNVPVAVEVTGILSARTDPTSRQRPFLLGFSVGHPAITAGTAGARVIDASSAVYILSNNHVLANSNDASIGDATLQPGPYDGGVYPTDSMASLADFQVIDFSATGSNTMDAAIALTSADSFSNSTPLDDGYGVPSAALFGDANSDGVFDNKADLLNLEVQKYGRTTKLTHGTITGINGSFSVCYEDFFGFCLLSANYDDQLVITPGTFSAGGDSGSLIVTYDGNKNPVGLLFAGSSTMTIANRIDLVLDRFNVTVDGSAGPPPPPPPPANSVHIGDLDGSATRQGSTWTASVWVTAHDEAHRVLGGASVSGNWTGGATGTGSCTTDVTGKCNVTKGAIRNKFGKETFTISNVTQGTLTYASGFNHDPDGDSNGTAITVAR
jgi:hypothetical protein